MAKGAGMPRATRGARRALDAAAQAFMGEGHADGALGETAGASRCDGHPMRPRPPLVFFAAIAVWLAALALFGVRMELGLVPHGVPEGLKAGEHTFELTADAQAGDFGMSARAQAVLDDGRRVDVLLSYEGDELYYARERIVAWAKFSDFSEESLKRYASEGLVCRASAREPQMAADQGWLASIVQARRWAAGLFDGIDGAGSALMRALLLGDRSRLEDDGLYDAMKTAGLAHMVAVSGSHLAVVGAFLSSLLVRVGIPRKACVAVLCLFYASYSVFTGLSAPVVRSAVMAAVGVSCIFAARRASPLAALSVCVCVLIAIEPANALSLSFFLSAASTFGVVVFTGLFASWLSAACANRFKPVCDTFAMTASANLPIFPVTACVFARLPLASPISNLAATPVFSVLLIGGLASIAVCALMPFVGMAALRVACAAAGLFCEGTIALSHVPYAAVPCSIPMGAAIAASIAAIVALWAFWPRLSGAFVRRIAACACVAALAWAAITPRLAPDELVMLDVGQGDAILIKSQGATLLVDTGNQDSKLLSALGRHGVALLDGVAITHHDDDHCASLPVLDSALARGGVYLAAPTFECDCSGCEELVAQARRLAGSRGVVALEAGQKIRVGRFTCTMVWPKEFSEEGGNADSMCLLAEYDVDGDGAADASAFLTGDAEGEQFAQMAQSGVIGHVDVFKAGHHGSKNSVDEEAFAVFSPSIALISVGAGNSYGHPAPETLEALEETGASVFRTDEDGDVTCRFSDEGIAVLTQKRAA